MKRALLIGLNYRGSDYELHACENDVNQLALRMSRCKVETKLVYDNIGIQDLLDLLDSYKAKQKKTDTFYFVYSGHGTQVPNSKEEDKYDEAICLWKNGYIDLFRDDRLRNKLNEFKGTVVVIFDSCFSGGMDRLVGKPATKRYVDYQTIFPIVIPQVDQAIDNLETKLTDPTKPKLHFLFASSKDEVSWEADGHGFFTGSLLRNWDKGFKYTSKLFPLVYEEVKQDQHPVYIVDNAIKVKKLF